MFQRFSILHMPVWAGVFFTLITTVFLNNFVLPCIPFLAALPQQGFMPYFTTAAGVLGIWFAMRGAEEAAYSCAGMATSCGLLGTSVGFIKYLMTYGSEKPDLGGMKFAFLSTAHGLVCLLLIEFLLLWPRADGRRIS
jgi:hypothetical protein